MKTAANRTTVSISKTTKARLDQWRATGQCYDGFLCQLVNLWEQRNGNDKHGIESVEHTNRRNC
jgi:hypothetical protein